MNYRQSNQATSNAKESLSSWHLRSSCFQTRSKDKAARVGFSAIVAFIAVACFGALSAQAATFTVTNTNESGAGSLRQAILNANGNPGADLIDFKIPGGGVHTIFVKSNLPTITDPV